MRHIFARNTPFRPVPRADAASVAAESVPSKLGTYQKHMTAFPVFKEQAHPRMAWILSLANLAP
ncbi:hypothetical protein, partial [Stenotrophomonas maltophilia]